MESHIGVNIFKTKMRPVINAFVRIFVHSILTLPIEYGYFAACAYVSCCVPHDIPLIIYDIVEFLKIHGDRLQTNVFSIVINVIKGLFNKYHLSFTEIEPDSYRIEDALYMLGNFLNSCNETYKYTLFPCLKLHSNTADEIAKEIISIAKTNHSYKQRLWLHNNAAYCICQTDLANLPTLLEEYLACNLSVSLQIDCLCALISRLEIDMNRPEIVYKVFCILVYHFFNSDYQMCEYLLLNYVHTIFLLHDFMETFTPSDELVNFFRSHEDSDHSVYAFSVFALVFSEVQDYTASDIEFIKRALQQYKKCVVLEDTDSLSHVCSSLHYLFKCCATDKHAKACIFEFAVLCLLNGQVDDDFCKFVAVAFKTQLASLPRSLETFFNFSNLYNCLGDLQLVYNLIINVTVWISSYTENDQDSFYNVETNCFKMPTGVFKTLLFSCFRDYYNCRKRLNR